MSDIYLGQKLILDDAGKVKDRTPLRVPRKLFGHMHLRGMTGAGKSSLAMISLVTQFMKPYEEGGVTKQDPIIVVDLGGDTNLFWSVKEAAEAQGRTFRFLTLDSDLQSFHFPPFQAVPAGDRNVLRISQMLIEAFHLDAGLVYGGSYYSSQNLAALLRVARTLTKEERNPTLHDVAAYLEEPQNRRLFKDADQVRMTFDFLLEYQSVLSNAKDPEGEIDLTRAIEKSEVIYFFCPSLTEPLTARLVAGLALYSAIASAVERRKQGAEPRTIRVFVDEFQEIVSRSLGSLLAQSRKFGLSLFLANQSTRQLENRDLSLADAVFEGTSVKQLSCPHFLCQEL